MREIIKTPSASIKVDAKYSVTEASKINYDSFDKRKAGEYEHKITVRISALILDSLKNIISSNKAGGNFEYTNVSDLIRKALEAYKDGMTLVTQRTKDQKKETSFRASKELREFYQNLHDNTKSEIIERAVSTFIKHKM